MNHQFLVRRLFALGVLLACIGPVLAQTPAAEIEREIDEQVWGPLLRASDNFDAEGFLAVHSPDLIRVSVDRNIVHGFARYSAEIRAGYPRARERGVRRTSTLRFLSRAQEGGLARDTGIFRSDAVLPSGEKRVSFTAFEMILRREGGKWKLLVDKDEWRGGQITEQEFLKGRPMTGANSAIDAP